MPLVSIQRNELHSDIPILFLFSSPVPSPALLLLLPVLFFPWKWKYDTHFLHSITLCCSSSLFLQLPTFSNCCYVALFLMREKESLLLGKGGYQISAHHQSWVNMTSSDNTLIPGSFPKSSLEDTLWLLIYGSHYRQEVWQESKGGTVRSAFWAKSQWEWPKWQLRTLFRRRSIASEMKYKVMLI